MLCKTSSSLYRANHHHSNLWQRNLTGCWRVASKRCKKRRCLEVNCGDKLQVVFVSTEVAPWSKVGGMGDVMHSLPVALASRGHRVMTVAPRYAAYHDAADTGLGSLVELPGPPAAPRKPSASKKASGQAHPAPSTISFAKYYLCQDQGVDRVFVDHPVYQASAYDDRSPDRVQTYLPGGADDLMGRYNVLCQAALAAPVTLWLNSNAKHSTQTPSSPPSEAGWAVVDGVAVPLGERPSKPSVLARLAARRNRGGWVASSGLSLGGTQSRAAPAPIKGMLCHDSAQPSTLNAASERHGNQHAAGQSAANVRDGTAGYGGDSDSAMGITGTDNSVESDSLDAGTAALDSTAGSAPPAPDTAAAAAAADGRWRRSIFSMQQHPTNTQGPEPVAVTPDHASNSGVHDHEGPDTGGDPRDGDSSQTTATSDDCVNYGKPAPEALHNQMQLDAGAAHAAVTADPVAERQLPSDAAQAGHDTAGAAQAVPGVPSAAALPPSGSSGAAQHQPGSAGASWPPGLQDLGEIVFVANDWPCALLPLWLHTFTEVAAEAKELERSQPEFGSKGLQPEAAWDDSAAPVEGLMAPWQTPLSEDTAAQLGQPSAAGPPPGGDQTGSWGGLDTAQQQAAEDGAMQQHGDINSVEQARAIDGAMQGEHRTAPKDGWGMSGTGREGDSGACTTWEQSGLQQQDTPRAKVMSGEVSDAGTSARTGGLTSCASLRTQSSDEANQDIFSSENSATDLTDAPLQSGVTGRVEEGTADSRNERQARDSPGATSFAGGTALQLPVGLPATSFADLVTGDRPPAMTGDRCLRPDMTDAHGTAQHAHGTAAVDAAAGLQARDDVQASGGRDEVVDGRSPAAICADSGRAGLQARAGPLLPGRRDQVLSGGFRDDAGDVRATCGGPAPAGAHASVERGTVPSTSGAEAKHGRDADAVEDDQGPSTVAGKGVLLGTADVRTPTQGGSDLHDDSACEAATGAATQPQPHTATPSMQAPTAASDRPLTGSGPSQQPCNLAEPHDVGHVGDGEWPSKEPQALASRPPMVQSTEPGTAPSLGLAGDTGACAASPERQPEGVTGQQPTQEIAAGTVDWSESATGEQLSQEAALTAESADQAAADEQPSWDAAAGAGDPVGQHDVVAGHQPGLEDAADAGTPDARRGQQPGAAFTPAAAVDNPVDLLPPEPTLAAAQLRGFRRQLGQSLDGAKVTLLIHNAAYTGNYPADSFERLGLPLRQLAAFLPNLWQQWWLGLQLDAAVRAAERALASLLPQAERREGGGLQEDGGIQEAGLQNGMQAKQDAGVVQQDGMGDNWVGQEAGELQDGIQDEGVALEAGVWEGVAQQLELQQLQQLSEQQQQQQQQQQQEQQLEQQQQLPQQQQSQQQPEEQQLAQQQPPEQQQQQQQQPSQQPSTTPVQPNADAAEPITTLVQLTPRTVPSAEPTTTLAQPPTDLGPAPAQPPLPPPTTSISWLHAAVAAAHTVLTVSQGYATELLAGMRIDPGLQKGLRAKDLRGIRNGADVSTWDPATDPHLPLAVRYDVDTVGAGKAAAKQLLQKRLGLAVDPDVPLFAFIGRLDDQKGADIILAALPGLLGSPEHPPRSHYISTPQAREQAQPAQALQQQPQEQQLGQQAQQPQEQQLGQQAQQPQEQQLGQQGQGQQAQGQQAQRPQEQAQQPQEQQLGQLQQAQEQQPVHQPRQQQTQELGQEVPQEVVVQTKSQQGPAQEAPQEQDAGASAVAAAAAVLLTTACAARAKLAVQRPPSTPLLLARARIARARLQARRSARTTPPIASSSPTPDVEHIPAGESQAPVDEQPPADAVDHPADSNSLATDPEGGDSSTAGDSAKPSRCLAMQLVMLGAGQAWLEDCLRQLPSAYPQRIATIPSFNESAAHLILAGADFLLVPSRQEPCGLVALHALRYGTVPIAAATGGLTDIVTDLVGYRMPPVGAVEDTAAFRSAVEQLQAAMALAAAERGGQRWQEMRQTGMRHDVSWDATIGEWEGALWEVSDRSS